MRFLEKHKIQNYQTYLKKLISNQQSVKKRLKNMNEKLISEYMVVIELPLPFDNEFISRIPKQREVIDKLMSERIISSYAVSVEEGTLWTVILAESEDQVLNFLLEFPIIDLVEYKISKLAFHNNIGLTFPQFSLN